MYHSAVSDRKVVTVNIPCTISAHRSLYVKVVRHNQSYEHFVQPDTVMYSRTSFVRPPVLEKNYCHTLSRIAAARSAPGSSPTNACVCICKYVDQNDSAAMMAAKKSAGVTPDMNLRNTLHTGNKACKQGIHPGFETHDGRHQKSKTGVSVAPQKGTLSSEKFLKKQQKQLMLTVKRSENSTGPKS